MNAFQRVKWLERGQIVKAESPKRAKLVGSQLEVHETTNAPPILSEMIPNRTRGTMMAVKAEMVRGIRSAARLKKRLFKPHCRRKRSFPMVCTFTHGALSVPRTHVGPRFAKAATSTQTLQEKDIYGPTVAVRPTPSTSPLVTFMRNGRIEPAL